jgi:hypothetical protein
MLSRSVRLVTIGTAILLACTPTEPCACPPSTSLFIVYGSIRRSDLQPAGGALVRAFAWRDGLCANGTASHLFNDPIRSDASGSFRALLSSLDPPGTRCLRLVAYAGDPGASDSVVASDLIVQFRHDREHPDSVGVALRFP